MTVGRVPFTIGGVLGRAFPIWGRNLVRFTILNAIIHSPLLLYAALALPRPDDPKAWRSFVMVQQIGQGLLGLVATAAVIHGVFQQLRGQPVGIGACLRVCIARFLPVLAVSILLGLLVGATFVPLGILVGMLAPAVIILIAGIGVLFLSSLIYCTFWLAIPVAVVERPGIVASLSRGARLARGAKLRIFVILLVVFSLQVAVGIMANVALLGKPVATVWATLLIAITVGTLMAVANAVAYHDVRVAKEGVGIEELVSVFA